MGTIIQFFDRLEKYVADGNEKAIHYLTAPAAVGAAFFVRFLLDPSPGSGFATTLFYPAIFIAGWYGGLRPSVLATALSTLAAFYFSRDTPAPAHGIHVSLWVQLSFFVFSGLLFQFVHGDDAPSRDQTETVSSRARHPT